MAAGNDTILAVLAVTIWLGLALISGSHAVMYKRDPRGATLWLLIGFVIPVVGPWFYWAFGINRLQRRAARHLGRDVNPALPRKRPDPLPDVERRGEIAGGLRSLMAVGDRVTGWPLLGGNKLRPLFNGEQAYPHMLEAIRGAQESITLASYIFDWDSIGRQFADELAGAAARGVQVHVLVDGVGALGSFSRMGRRLLKSEVEVAAFFPLRFPLGRLRLNMRNHRKILVVDGYRAFTGGMNISRRHLMESGSPRRCEDIHFEVGGPVVSQIQRVFSDDWVLATGKKLQGDTYFPELADVGEALARGIASGPDEDFEKIHWIIQAAFDTAEHSVRVLTPYFVPTKSLLSVMSMAAMRGVRIKIGLPTVVDIPFMRWVADAYLWQLLEHDIEVFHRPAPFAHTKLVIVDDEWVLMGSANLDPRSFRLNFEFNVESFDGAMARELAGWFDGQMAHGKLLSLEDVDGRPRLMRLRDGLVRLASPYL